MTAGHRDSGETPITAESIDAAIAPHDDAAKPKLSGTPSKGEGKPPTSAGSVIAGVGMLETLRIARRVCDWALVDTVIRHLEVVQFEAE